MSDMPKMPEPAQAVPIFAEGRGFVGTVMSYTADQMQAHHAAWQAYVAHLREQVMGCVPGERNSAAIGHNACRAETLANLQALFGERQDDR